MEQKNIQEDEQSLSQDMKSIFNVHNDATQRAITYLLIKKNLSKPNFNPNEPIQEGKTHLHYAAQNEHKEAIKLLLSNSRVDINVQDNQGKRPLHYAAQNHQEIIR